MMFNGKWMETGSFTAALGDETHFRGVPRLVSRIQRPSRMQHTILRGLVQIQAIDSCRQGDAMTIGSMIYSTTARNRV